MVSGSFCFYSQGEDNTNVRSFENEVKIDQVPALMRALGYYPSEMEIEALMYEIRYDNVLERGKPKDHISFEEFIKCKLESILNSSSINYLFSICEPSPRGKLQRE